VRFGRANPVLVPALLAVAVFVGLGASEAGFYPINSSTQPGLGWYPAGLLLLALLALALVTVRPRAVPRAVILAACLLAGFVAWSFLSIAWAEAGSVAWDGANRAAIYLGVFCLFALWPATEGGARVLIGALGLGIAAIGVVELLSANASSQPVLYFVDARLTEPAGYVNANVALWTIGLWPCLYLATARRVFAPIRGLALGGAGVLACLAAMGQSRGWVLSIPLAALLFVALMPYRGRAIAAVGALAVGVALISPSLLAVHDDFTRERLDGLLATATSHILLMAAVLAVAGTVVALAEQRVTPAPGLSRTLDRGVIGAAAVCVLVGAALVLARTGDPVHDVSASWQSFKEGGEGGGAGQSRFASVGTNRYDFWRVSSGLFLDHPLGGVGSANFQQDYLAEGGSAEQPRYPHSLELGVLSQTGIIGALLLGASLVSAGVALFHRRRSGPEAAAAVAGSATVFGYWFVHGSIDWFWEFPGLTAPAFAMLGVACAVGRSAQAGGPARETRRIGRPVRLAAGVAGAIGAILLGASMVAPWLAERETERASSGWTASPRTAFDRLDRAATLNPLSPDPHLTAALIAIRTEDSQRAEVELGEVLDIEPRTPFALAELAALAYERGEKRRALALIERAVSDSPRDPTVLSARKEMAAGRAFGIEELNDSFLKIARYRVGRG